MGAPVGNDNAKKGRMFYDRLRTILKQDEPKFNNIAMALINAAEKGEPWAIKELLDRIDGKPVQATSIENPDGTAITGLKVVFIDGTNGSSGDNTES